jgi:hypothetical protein
MLTGNIFDALLLTGNAIPALRKTISQCKAINEVLPNKCEAGTPERLNLFRGQMCTADSSLRKCTEGNKICMLSSHMMAWSS